MLHTENLPELPKSKLSENFSECIVLYILQPKSKHVFNYLWEILSRRGLAMWVSNRRGELERVSEKKENGSGFRWVACN